MGQTKKDRASDRIKGILDSALADSVANHIVAVGTKQLEISGVIIPMDPDEAEILKVIL